MGQRNFFFGLLSLEAAVREGSDIVRARKPARMSQ